MVKLRRAVTSRPVVQAIVLIFASFYVVLTLVTFSALSRSAYKYAEELN